jgi:hypothetical protein
MAEHQVTNGRLPQLLAQRLRVIQQEMAERPPDERKRHLASEIETALQSMLPEERQEVLHRLEDYFPPWGEVPSDKPQETVSDLVKRLAQMVGNDPARKQETLRVLRDHGFVVTYVPEDSVKRLRAVMGIPNDQKVDASRLMEVIALYAQFVLPLDEFAHNAWRDYTPGKNELRKPIKDASVRYLGFVGLSESEPRVQQTRGELEQLFRGLSQRLRALLGGFRRFTQRHTEKFAPSEIESLVAGFGKDRRAWARYVELCGGPDREHLDAEMQKTFAKVLEEIGRRGND